jgi:L-ascorbate metabolism protein UlaG (beta-lactamase superfamily)
LAVAASLAACASGGPCESPFAASPQFDRASCTFRNAEAVDVRASSGPVAIWFRMLFAKPAHTVPVDPLPVRDLDRAALDALDPAAVHVIRLGHSSHLLKLRGRYWLIDPVFGERASPVSFAGPKRFHRSPLPLAAVPPVEGLVLSHDHYDHLDTETIRALLDRVERYFVPLGVKARLTAQGVPAERIVELDWWQATTHGTVSLVAAPAQHFSGRTLWDRNRTLWASWVIVQGETRIFYSGDSGFHGGLRTIGERFGPFDVALMENGAYNPVDWPRTHMTPEQTLQAARDVRARLLYGVHNSTFDLAFHPWQEPMERLSDLAEQASFPHATPVVGEVLTLGRAHRNVRWWRGLR